MTLTEVGIVIIVVALVLFGIACLTEDGPWEWFHK